MCVLYFPSLIQARYAIVLVFFFFFSFILRAIIFRYITWYIMGSVHKVTATIAGSIEASLPASVYGWHQRITHRFRNFLEARVEWKTAACSIVFHLKNQSTLPLDSLYLAIHVLF